MMSLKQRAAAQQPHSSPSPTVEQFFMPSVDAIVADIQRRLENQTIEVSHLF